MDRVRVTPDGFGIADIKTGKTAVSADGTVKTQGHAAQVAVYELLASQELGVSMSAPAQIIGLQVAKTDKGRRSGIGEIHGGCSQCNDLVRFVQLYAHERKTSMPKVSLGQYRQKWQSSGKTKV